MAHPDPNPDEEESPLVLHARARAFELFNNPVVQDCLYEHADFKTRATLLRVSRKALRAFTPMIWREVGLEEYDRMKEGLVPMDRLALYTSSVRTLLIGGLLPMLPLRVKDVWTLFGVFTGASSIRWSHGELHRSMGSGVSRHTYHRTIEPTWSAFNLVQGTPDSSPTYHVPTDFYHSDPRIAEHTFDVKWSFASDYAHDFYVGPGSTIGILEYATSNTGAFALPRRTTTILHDEYYNAGRLLERCWGNQYGSQLPSSATATGNRWKLDGFRASQVLPRPIRGQSDPAHCQTTWSTITHLEFTSLAPSFLNGFQRTRWDVMTSLRYLVLPVQLPPLRYLASPSSEALDLPRSAPVLNSLCLVLLWDHDDGDALGFVSEMVIYMDCVCRFMFQVGGLSCQFSLQIDPDLLLPSLAAQAVQYSFERTMHRHRAAHAGEGSRFGWRKMERIGIEVEKGIECEEVSE